MIRTPLDSLGLVYKLTKGTATMKYLIYLLVSENRVGAFVLPLQRWVLLELRYVHAKYASQKSKW